MTSPTPAADPFVNRLTHFAQGAAALSLFIAPFRSTAGFRAGLLVLAALAIILVWSRTRNQVPRIMPARALVWAAALWAITVGAWSLFGPDPMESLRSWRGDVLTPLLACWVFYVLTENVQQLNRYLAVLGAGLLVLAVMLALDPFQPTNASHAPYYGTVGLASTWLITLAPLLPFAWRAGADGNQAWRIGTVVAVAALLSGAWFTGNRMIWVCYAAMLAIGAAFAIIRIESARQRGRVLLASIVTACVLLAGFYGASLYRANVTVGNSDAAIEFMRNDNRNRVWEETIGMIREAPLAGHGYALPAVGDAFTARFVEPQHRGVIRHAHNMVLNYAIQMGVFAAGVLVLLFAALWWTFARMTAQEVTETAALAGVCGLMLVTGFFLRNMADDFFMRHTLLLFAAMVGMLLGVGLRASSAKRRLASRTALPPLQKGD